jgi:hypothetical protein
MCVCNCIGAEHKVVSYNDRDLTSKIATVYPIVQMFSQVDKFLDKTTCFRWKPIVYFFFVEKIEYKIFSQNTVTDNLV